VPENNPLEGRAALATSNRNRRRDHLGINGEIISVRPGDFVGISTKDGPFQGWSNSKTSLDKRLKEAGMTAPWRLHDLRRTAATRMADLGVQPHIIEAVLNHVSGHKAGVAGIYNRSTYAAEKKAALMLWADHVMTLIRAGD
jgi:integrase